MEEVQSLELADTPHDVVALLMEVRMDFFVSFGLQY
jgi:hypothetical protein